MDQEACHLVVGPIIPMLDHLERIQVQCQAKDPPVSTQGSILLISSLDPVLDMDQDLDNMEFLHEIDPNSRTRPVLEITTATHHLDISTMVLPPEDDRDRDPTDMADTPGPLQVLQATINKWDTRVEDTTKTPTLQQLSSIPLDEDQVRVPPVRMDIHTHPIEPWVHLDIPVSHP